MGLRDRLRRLSTSTDDLHAHAIGSQLAALDVSPLDTVPPRTRVRVAGEVTRMRSRPTDGVPILEVRISDGAASAIVEWRGRRSIGGITLGRRLLVEGVARREGTHLVFSNPEYTLLP